MKIIIPGGSGQVGTILANYFGEKGHEIVILSRNTQNKQNSSNIRYVEWDGETAGSWTHEVESSDVVINLAGKNVNCRYNDKNQRLIMSSRVDSTTIIGEVINNAPKPPKIWLQASTATIYAHSFDHPNDEFTGKLGGGEENAPRKWDYSVEVAKTWEETADKFDSEDTRLVKLRTSLVMSPDKGGIFDTLINLVRFGLGGKAGSGEQYVSWIHHVDFARAIEKIILDEQIDGVVNITAPNPLQFKDFMKQFRDAYGRWLGLPATKWMLEIGAFFMRSETELILKSRRVIPGKLLKSEFDFTYPEWDKAVQELVDQWKSRN